MNNRMIPIVLVAVVAFGLGLGMLTGPVETGASDSWIAQIERTLEFYEAKYPTSNFQPYDNRLVLAEKAWMVGDQDRVKHEMEQFFSMLRTRAHGIHEVAAQEVFNFALMVTPLQEYGISVPPTTSGGIR